MGGAAISKMEVAKDKMKIAKDLLQEASSPLGEMIASSVQKLGDRKS